MTTLAPPKLLPLWTWKSQLTHMNVTSSQKSRCQPLCLRALSTLASRIFHILLSLKHSPFPGSRSHEARQRPIYGSCNSLLSIARRLFPGKGPFRCAVCGVPSIIFPCHSRRCTGTHQAARQRSGTPVYLALRTSLWGTENSENSCRRSKVTSLPSFSESLGDLMPTIFFPA